MEATRCTMGHRAFLRVDDCGTIVLRKGLYMEDQIPIILALLRTIEGGCFDPMNDSTTIHCLELPNIESDPKIPIYGDYCDIFAVEVTSRKLFASRGVPIPIPAGSNPTTDHQHTIAPDQEIDTILGALHRAFNSPAAETDNRIARWIVVNKTCGLHVHVGNDEKGFPLQTVKNVLSLCTAFERVIDGMHSQPRIGGTALALAALDALDSELGTGDLSGRDAVSGLPITERKVPNVPLTEHFIARAWCQLRKTARPPEDSTPPPAQADSGLHTKAFLEVIRAAPNLDSLAELVLKKETTVSLMYLLGGWNDYAKTIEFRQHAAATSSAETLPWIEFVTLLVKYAHESSAELIHEVCTHAAGDPGLSLLDLLVLISMREQTSMLWLDRVEGVVPFFDHVAARAEVENVFDDFGDCGGPVRRLALELIEERRTECDHAAVGKAVRNKFDAGGYGQFSRGFIDAYAPDLEEEEKVKLTIGWEAPAVTEPESGFELDGIEKIL